MAETLVQKQMRLVLEQQARELADRIARECPAGVGFALFIFDFGEGGNIAYISNAERAAMIRALEIMIARWKRGQTTEPGAPG